MKSRHMLVSFADMSPKADIFEPNATVLAVEYN